MFCKSVAKDSVNLRKDLHGPFSLCLSFGCFGVFEMGRKVRKNRQSRWTGRSGKIGNLCLSFEMFLGFQGGFRGGFFNLCNILGSEVDRKVRKGARVIFPQALPNQATVTPNNNRQLLLINTPPPALGVWHRDSHYWRKFIAEGYTR